MVAIMIVALAGAATLFLVLSSLRNREDVQGESRATHERPRKDVDTLRVGTATVAVEFARAPSEWARGLSSRDALPEGSGMLFVFPTAEPRIFWMKDTRISLDMIWVRDGKVIGITADVPPEQGVVDAVLRHYPSPGGVDHVLEVNAGWAAEHDVKIGDAVTLSGLRGGGTE